MINTVVQGVLVATGLSTWVGCSDPQGSGRGRESTSAAKMILCPGCHNPCASCPGCHNLFVRKTHNAVLPS